MQSQSSLMSATKAAAPWYAHRWPWFLMLGPLLVMLAGIPTAWLAFSRQDALVVDDYYKQGKAINQDLRRDSAAAKLKLEFRMNYDPAAGKLTGNITSLGQPLNDKLIVRLIHSTQPEKDMQFDVQSDIGGNFVINLPLLEVARWQIMVESAQRDWRLNGEWLWPHQRTVKIDAGS